jgi:glyoxylase-like metal-dependent hydrolase (beta-lactamase superfamily II)
VFHKLEYAAWEEATKRGDNPPGNVWRFNCEPVVAAGQALLVDDDFQLDDTLWLTPTPGHSPCHCCVNIRSGGQRAVVIGDLERIPVMFEHSRHGERSSCILAG